MDEIAEVIETLDMLISAMSIPMPPEIHLKALRESLPDVRERLFEAYLSLGGEDHWDEI